MTGRDFTQRPAQQQRVADGVAEQRQRQRHAVLGSWQRRPCGQQVDDRQAAGQRRPAPGHKPGRQLRCIHRAGGQARHGQSQREHEHPHKTQPQAQGFVALLRCDGRGHSHAALPGEPMPAPLTSIHTAVSTSAEAMQRLKTISRPPVGSPATTGPANQWRSIEPTRA